MNIKELLEKNENVLANFKENYATDRRLIFVKKNSYSDIAYNHITSITYAAKITKWLLASGIVLFFGGLLVFSRIPTLVILIIIGVIMIVLSLVFKERGYLIRTSGGDKFYIDHGHEKDDKKINDFVRIIRQKAR